MLDTSDIIRLAAKFGLAPYQQERFKQGYVHYYQGRTDLFGDDESYDFGYSTAELVVKREKEKM